MDDKGKRNRDREIAKWRLSALFGLSPINTAAAVGEIRAGEQPAEKTGCAELKEASNIGRGLVRSRI